MCGIAGISCKQNINPILIKKMTDIIRHRGPDDEGFLAINTYKKKIYHLTGPDSKVEKKRIESFRESANLFLGHRRLSILDLSPAGHQPMSNEDESIWIVFNGEIYNYIELKCDLQSKGYKFKTNTDTEVLLFSYEEWGRDCLNKFNGMWAFVIYDKRKNILFGSRDRFGVKPLYYYLDDNFFVFSSEIKAIVSFPFIKKEINYETIFDYFVLDYGLKNEEFFKNINELLPSYSFEYEISNNKFTKWKYYNLKYIDRWEKFNERKAIDYINNIKELLFDSINLRLRADVPVGTCLSGGIDSSVIVCIINKLLETQQIKQIGEQQKIFTASFNIEKIDESRWAHIVNQKTKTSWYRTFPEAKQFLEEIEELVYTQDIPFGSTSIYAQYKVMELAKNSNIKVLIDGQGGDELFSGYYIYYISFFIEMIRNLDINRFIKELIYLYNAPISYKSLISGIIKFLINRKFLYKLIRKDNIYINRDFWNSYSYKLNNHEINNTSLNHTLFEYIEKLNLKTLLRYEDRNSMKFSIETRTPFADSINLIEYLFTIPSVYKIYKGWSKYLLRESVKGIIPEDIRLRKDKIGFATPEYLWLNEIKNELINYITDDLKDFINISKLRKDWNKIIKDGNISIWKFINLGIWKKVYKL